MTNPSPRGRDLATARWDQVYVQGWIPWDIGRPQPAFVRLADAGELRSPLLDCGCGTGEHALLAAGRGIRALGIDLAPTAIEQARRKAAERGLAAEFAVGNALELERLGRRFATVIDSGTFHVFSDELRARYVAALAAVVYPGGTVHLLCFSERTPGTAGPRRVTQREIRQAFADGWEVSDIRADRFEVRDDFAPERPHAWLARIVRA